MNLQQETKNNNSCSTYLKRFYVVYVTEVAVFIIEEFMWLIRIHELVVQVDGEEDYELSFLWEVTSYIIEGKTEHIL